MIAEAIIAVAKEFKDIPVVVRFQGTNEEQGQRMVSGATNLR
jgi:succinyl-CoA synthetase beta subunit